MTCASPTKSSALKDMRAHSQTGCRTSKGKIDFTGKMPKLGGPLEYPKCSWLGDSAAHAWWIEAKVTTQHPTMHRMAPAAENCPAANEEPYVRAFQVHPQHTD